MMTTINTIFLLVQYC